MLAGGFGEFGVDFGEEDGFFGVGGFGEDAAEGVGDEGAAPELEAGGLVGLVEGAVDEDGALLVADAVDGSDDRRRWRWRGRAAWCARRRTGGSVLLLFGGVPADGGGEEEDFGAA